MFSLKVRTCHPQLLPVAHLPAGTPRKLTLAFGKGILSRTDLHGLWTFRPQSSHHVCTASPGHDIALFSSTPYKAILRWNDGGYSRVAQLGRVCTICYPSRRLSRRLFEHPGMRVVEALEELALSLKLLHAIPYMRVGRKSGNSEPIAKGPGALRGISSGWGLHSRYAVDLLYKTFLCFEMRG